MASPSPLSQPPSPPQPTTDTTSTAHEEPRQSWEDPESVELPGSPIDVEKPEPENELREIVDASQQPMDVECEPSAQPEPSEYAIIHKEEVRDEGGLQERDQLSQSPERVLPNQSSATRPMETPLHRLVSEKPRAVESRKDAGKTVLPSPRAFVSAMRGVASGLASSLRHDANDLSPRYRESKDSGAGQPDTTTSHVTSPQATELSEHYETLQRSYYRVRDKLDDKRQLLKERNYQIKCLEADLAALQQRYEEQSAAYRSCQSQLDNVQRFISTADAHADQDIIQKLQELNEEVYQVSMMMADYLADNFARQSAAARQTKENDYVLRNDLGTIGENLVNYLATAGEEEDIGLLLQIAFQGYLSHFLCYIVSSWTVDRRLNVLLEKTYQRLRKAETQAIYGHWRSLTRAHILPTHVTESKSLVEYTMTGLSDIIMITGLVSPQPDAVAYLSSKFGEKILTIILHAGILGNMVSGMVSGDFEVFTVQPETTFDKETMVDANKSRKMRETETVLCVSRVGLRKQMDEKTVTLTKAQVVLRSFLD